ncbi:MAG: DUF305 domain-containing protein [Chloroflexota bacterium]|nr:DUF305 domain-containing protein [Chloroflexota bacterium]
MATIGTRIGRGGTAMVLALLLMTGMRPAMGAQDQPPIPHSHEAATPPAADPCATAATPATPMAVVERGGMDMGTPVVRSEFDQAYIDMMIPHHASILAVAQAAQPRLSDDRLRQIAEDIIAAQGLEIDELRGYRDQFYGSAEPLPMDAGMMEQVTPGLPMDETMAQMDATTQVTAFCAATDPNLVFIDLVILHHESATVASVTALDQAVQPEIRAIAERVIRDQQRETDELRGIREARYGSVTLQGSPAAVSHGGPVADQVSFMDALRAEGITVDVVSSLFPDVPFSGAQAGTTLRLSGGGLVGPAEVQAYDYTDPTTAATDAGQILPDGNLPTVMIEWIAPPHFFRTGRIIVLYVGTDPAVLEILTQLLGPQFAGR